MDTQLRVLGVLGAHPNLLPARVETKFSQGGTHGVPVEPAAIFYFYRRWGDKQYVLGGGTPVPHVFRGRTPVHLGE